MLKLKLIWAGALISGMATLVACGGGGSGSSDTTQTNTSTSRGPITAFGSIYVNGQEIETDSADIYVEDEVADESDLRVGMMVHVEHDGNGNAHSVHHDDDLEGIVIANNIPAGQTTGTMDIMGQTVTVTADTVFESYVAGITDAGMVAAGNIVEVSGHSTGTGTITATRMEVKAVDLGSYSDPEGIELKGIVENHSEADSTFDIGNMTINYAGATLDDLPNGIDNGMFVEVKSTAGMNMGVLMAYRVEREHDDYAEYHGNEDDEHEFHGMVMAMTADTITVNSQVCIITDQTMFEDGVRADIVVGAMVEVEGYFNASGDFIAHEIELEDQESTHEMYGTVASVDAPEPNVGTITMMNGDVVHVNAETIMHDDRDDGMTPDHHFNLQDLAANDYVEIYVFANGDGSFTATKVEREDAPVATP